MSGLGLGCLGGGFRTCTGCKLWGWGSKLEGGQDRKKTLRIAHKF